MWDHNVIYGSCNGFLVYPFFVNLFSKKRTEIFENFELEYWIFLFIGFTFFLGFVAWFIISAQNRVKKYEKEIISYDDDEKARLDNNISLKKENILLWAKSYEDGLNAKTEENLREEYNQLREGKTPEDFLKKNKPKMYKKEEPKGFFGAVADIIDNGKSEVEWAEEQYKNMFKTYNVYESRYNLRKFMLDRARINYEYSVEQANLLAGRIKQITDKINPKERKSLFLDVKTKESTDNMELISLSNDNILSLKNDIEKTNQNFSNDVSSILSNSEDGTQLAIGGAFLALEAFSNDPIVAIQHDADMSRITDNTKFNSVVSHESMSTNEKFKKSYEKTFNSFLFIGPNSPIKITEARSGLSRRLLDVTPTGNTLDVHSYRSAVSSVDYALGAIAHRCIRVYKTYGPDYYNGYRPMKMMELTNGLKKLKKK